MQIAWWGRKTKLKLIFRCWRVIAIIFNYVQLERIETGTQNYFVAVILMCNFLYLLNKSDLVLWDGHHLITNKQNTTTHPFKSSWLPLQVRLWICWAKMAWRTLLNRLWVWPRRNRKTETCKGTVQRLDLAKRCSVKVGPHIRTHAKRVNHWWCPMTCNN